MEFFKPGRHFDFMGQRKFWITLSILLVAISTALVFYPGPNYGTDFRGGTEIEVAFTKTVDAAAIRKAVEGSGFSSPEVIKIIDANNPNHYFIKVQDVSALNDESQGALRKALCLTTDSAAVVSDAN